MSSTNPPKVLGILVATLGLALVGGGVHLQVNLGGGGSYFIVVGSTAALSGLLLFLGNSIALLTYGLTLVIVWSWSLVEAGSHVDQLIARVAMPTLIGLYLFSSKVRSRLVERDSGFSWSMVVPAIGITVLAVGSFLAWNVIGSRHHDSLKVKENGQEIASATTASVPALPAWLVLSPEGGRFRVEIPDSPVAKQEIVRTSAGDMILFSFDVNRPELKQKFSVQYADYPDALLRKMKSPDVVLSNASTVDVENIKGTLVSEKTLTLDRYPGRELHIENAETVMRVRLFFVDGRLYKMVASCPKQLGFSNDDSRFMTSFQLNP